MGITEVELPMSYKLKNIEDTELATRRRLAEMERKKLGILDETYVVLIDEICQIDVILTILIRFPIYFL